MNSVFNKWDYSKVFQVCYSDEKCESYKKAAEFLGDTVEDWGGGTGWAKRYFKNYRNIDASEHDNVDEVVDLVKYKSKVDNILIRQVLEAEPRWEKILKNAKKSFKKKLCIVIGTPLVNETRNGPANSVITSEGKVDDGRVFQEIYFNKEDILHFFPSNKYRTSEEIIETKQYYNKDWILYVEKI